MIIEIFGDKLALAKAAAERAAAALKKALKKRKCARIIAATGASQFDFLEALTARRDIDWR